MGDAQHPANSQGDDHRRPRRYVGGYGLPRSGREARRQDHCATPRSSTWPIAPARPLPAELVRDRRNPACEKYFPHCRRGTTRAHLLHLADRGVSSSGAYYLATRPRGGRSSSRTYLCRMTMPRSARRGRAPRRGGEVGAGHPSPTARSCSHHHPRFGVLLEKGVSLGVQKNCGTRR